MFNAKRIEDIRKNIQISTLLSDHEKSDWLNLLELMNDKQLGELEEILAATPVQMKSVAQAQTVQPQNNINRPATPMPNGETLKKMPPLSHIANIPADVTMAHSVPQQLNSVPKPSTPPKVPIAPNKAVPEKTVPTPPVAEAKPIPVDVTPVSPPQKQNLVISSPLDVQTFTAATLHEYELQSVADAMRNIIQQNGYFQILQRLEASPLYQSYLQTGKTLLGHTDNTSTPVLTQSEFEFIADLLRHMRFNAW